MRFRVGDRVAPVRKHDWPWWAGEGVLYGTVVAVNQDQDTHFNTRIHWTTADGRTIDGQYWLEDNLILCPNGLDVILDLIK